LDAGCGFGGTAASLAAKYPGAKVTGLNIDPRQLVLARQNAPAAKFVEGDACAMPFPDASFDRVLAVECIFHFPSRRKFLLEAARVLKPGGRIGLSDFVPADPNARESWIGSLIRRKIEVGYGKSGAGWNEGDYYAMAKGAGLRVVLDRDVNENVQPTYAVLLDAIAAGAPRGDSMLWPTRLLAWVSKLGAVRYRIVGFSK
jgi:ubiquinone/menaquinone biosynthesis C-methylase UbiE